ncbi:MAG TPA: FtsX-like permease family protein [Myxococcales bacterium]|nr:FtsX-like permease family protein [Myxococcales bacterium]
MSTLKLLIVVGLRNLHASTMTLIIGGIIFFGTLLVLVGGAVLNSMDTAMAKSIIGSVAGHLQIYSSKSKEDLALYGNMGGEADVEAIQDFSQVKRLLEQVPNVEKVVPMGINGALVMGGNTIDLTLAELRDKVNRRREGDASPELAAQIDSLKKHVRHMVELLQKDQKNLAALSTARAQDPENAQAVEKALSDPFWTGFDAQPLDALEFLENRIAPQAADADLLYIRYVGTNLDDFQKAFDRMEIVDGHAVPPGQRGFLFSKQFYEEGLKVKVARRLDVMKEKIDVNHATFARSEELRKMVKENQSQTREILYQLDQLKTADLVDKLRAALKTDERDPGKLLELLLDTGDQNFQERYQLFYAAVAPLLQLYRVRIGDTLTIQAFTRSGYVQSVNVKVYGTYQFKGLEKAALAGGLNLMDLMSFRDLYGYLSPERAEEIQKLKAQSGASMIDRDKAEAELFGGQPGGREVVAQATPGVIDEPRELAGGTAGALRRKDLVSRVYSREEIEGGVVLNAAVILKDPRQLEQTLREINDRARAAGTSLKAVSWQQASGFLGQLVLGIRLLLGTAVAILFIVVLVIINNSMMMATMQRVREIGTMRAIGAQKSLVLWMVLVETVVLALVFGLASVVVGSGIVLWLHRVGIPAFDDNLYFFFSGPRLYPDLGAGTIIAATVVVSVVSAISTLYPAMTAMRVPPVTAMQTDE